MGWSWLLSVVRGTKPLRFCSPHPVALHQAGDTILATGMSQGFEFGRQARTAVTTFRPLVEMPDRHQQLVVGLLPGRGFAGAPGVITGAAHGKYPAKHRQRIFLFHDLDALVAVGHVVETIPKVFFRMSRCWRN